MTESSSPIKVGVLAWNQYTDWPSMQRLAQRSDELGYDSLWTWDHLYPIVGNHEGPIFECYTAMAAVASSTRNASIGQ